MTRIHLDTHTYRKTAFKQVNKKRGGLVSFQPKNVSQQKKSEGICQRHSALTLVFFALNHLASSPVFFYYITLILFSFQRLAVLLTSFLWLPLPTRLDIWISRRHAIYICDKGHQKQNTQGTHYEDSQLKLRKDILFVYIQKSSRAPRLAEQNKADISILSHIRIDMAATPP